MIIKATFIFGLRDRGWSESLFFEQSASVSLSVAYAKAEDLAKLRRTWMGTQAYIKAVRVSIERLDDGSPVIGDSYLAYTNFNGTIGGDADDADTAVQVIMRSNDARKRKLMFARGIPDAVNVRGGEFDPNALGFQTKFDQWATEVIGRDWGWMTSNRAGRAIVSNYVGQANGQVLFTLGTGIFGAGPNYSAQMVRVSRLNGKSVLNRQLLILPQSASTALTVKPYAVGPFVYPGIMQAYTKTFQAARQVEGQKIVERKAGAPLLVPVGRASTRATI